MNRPQKLMTNLHQLLFYLLLAVAVGLAGWLSNRHVQLWDWSAGGRNSLSRTSQELLARLQEPLHITSFAPESPELRRRISDIIQRYRRYRPDIQFNFVNPDRQPELVRQLGIKVMGELRLEYQGRAENISSINEEALSNTIQQLMQGAERWIGIIEGHGERRADGRANHDIGGFGDELQRKGYKLRHLNLATMAELPQNLSLLIIASPQVDYLPQEVASIQRYLEAGGNLLWLLEPGSLHGLDRIKKMLGVLILPGTIVDANSASMRLPDPTMALVTHYPRH
ncbi:MAG: GldG family protein, partial [Gammaproteobacteria bacterium]|nr:GldG family protein [Gammaproteobacteria bacterium]